MLLPFANGMCGIAFLLEQLRRGTEVADVLRVAVTTKET
jgi:hypothetical protein